MKNSADGVGAATCVWAAGEGLSGQLDGISAPRAIQLAARPSTGRDPAQAQRAGRFSPDFFEVRRGGSPLCDQPSLQPHPTPIGLSYHSLPKELSPLNTQVRLSLQASRQVDFGRRLAAKLDSIDSPERRAIHAALVRFSSEQVAADEFARSSEYLNDLDSIHGYLQAEVGLVVVFMPQNLPLYSLILFAVVPALQARRVVVHFPSDLTPVERAHGRAAPAALPTYRLVLEQLSRLLRQVVRDSFDSPGSRDRGETPVGRRLKGLWRGGRNTAHLQRPGVHVQLNDFGAVTDDHETVIHARDSRFSKLFGDISAVDRRSVFRASAVCAAARRRPHDGGALLEANLLARDICAKVLAREADVVIFTGSSHSARHVREAVGDHGLLLVNGSGYNPVVIGLASDSELDEAVKKTVHARLFHNGQDCAAPDAILVENSMMEAFLLKLQAQIVLSVGQPSLMLPLLSEDRFKSACSFIQDSIDGKHGRRVICGSGNNALAQALEPTVVVQKIVSTVTQYGQFSHLTGEKIAYREFYAPVFYVLGYDEGTSDLPFYFNGGKYHENEMYVSRFGSCPWLGEHLPRSEILAAETVFDIDRGTKGYGAMGSDSTYAVHRGTLKIGPIQVPREISLYYRRRIKSSSESHRSALAPRVTGSQLAATRELFCRSVRERIQDVLMRYQARRSPGTQPCLKAAFFYGPIVDDDFGFSAQATLDAGPSGGQLCLGHSERINMLIIFDRELTCPEAQRALAELPTILTRAANWSFNERSSIVVAHPTIVRQALDDAHRRGDENTQRMLNSALPRQQVRYLHIIEGLAAQRRLGCAADNSRPESKTVAGWRARSKAIYRCWQEGIHRKLTSEGFFATSSALTRRYGQPRDIIVSDAMHMRTSR